MRFYILIFIFFYVNFSFSQNRCKSANRKITKIEKKILLGNIEVILEDLKKIELLCGDPVFFHSLGDLYYSIKKVDKAFYFYLECYRESGLSYFNSVSIFHFLKYAYNSGSYEVFNTVVNDSSFYLSIQLDTELKKMIEKNQFALNMKKDSIIFNPILLDINSLSDDYFPTMPINSDVIIFTHRETSEFKQLLNYLMLKQLQQLRFNP